MILLYSDPAMTRDYYEVLGIARTATADDIRRAHRKLAKEFHPDKNKAPESAKRFSQVQEAYDTLSDPAKRAQYDQFGASGPGGNPFSGRGAAQGQSPWQHADEQDLGDMLGGLGGIGDFFRTGGSGRGRTAKPRAHAGQDAELEVTVDFMTAAVGGTRSVPTRDAAGKTEAIDVRIPAGISSGGFLRIPGRGFPGSGGGPPGDLMLVIRVARHPWFHHVGLDISIEVPITIVEAALGTTVDIPLLKGSVSLRIPAGSTSGQKLRLPGKGIAPTGKTAGDFFAVLQIVAPTTLDATDAAALKELGAKLPNPRERRWL